MDGVQKLLHSLPGCDVVPELRVLAEASGLKAVSAGVDVAVGMKVAFDAVSTMDPLPFTGLSLFNSSPPVDKAALAIMQKKCGAELKVADHRASHYASERKSARGLDVEVWDIGNVLESVEDVRGCGQEAKISDEVVESRVRQVWEKGYEFYLKVAGGSDICSMDDFESMILFARGSAAEGKFAVDEGRLHRIEHKKYMGFYKQELKLAERDIRRKNFNGANEHVANAKYCAERGNFAIDERCAKVERRMPLTP